MSHPTSLCRVPLPVSVRSDELQLVFTSISRSHPSRPYLLSVYIDQHNDYAVQQCEPAIERLPELLAEVNRTVITAAGEGRDGRFRIICDARATGISADSAGRGGRNSKW